MTCASLTDILLSHAMRTVDFLSLDIEGSEERALLGLDFSRVHVSVVLMECEFEEALAAIADGGVPNASANSKQRAAAVLLANGFRLVQGLGKAMLLLRPHGQELPHLWPCVCLMCWGTPRQQPKSQ